jgi:hypothetical protein
VVTSGTGAYAHLDARGTIITHLDPQDGSFALTVLSASP